MKNLIALVFMLLVGCAANQPSNNDLAEQQGHAEQDEITHHDRVYFFQHKVIADWVFQSRGAFFHDLQRGEISHLLDTASDIVSPEYAKGLRVTPIKNRNAVLITFPEPKSPLNCYFVMIQKLDDGYAYYTYEKTVSFENKDFENKDYVGVVGGWGREGSHYNYGPREFTTAEEFTEEVLGLTASEYLMRTSF